MAEIFFQPQLHLSTHIHPWNSSSIVVMIADIAATKPEHDPSTLWQQTELFSRQRNSSIQKRLLKRLSNRYDIVITIQSSFKVWYINVDTSICLFKCPHQSFDEKGIFGLNSLMFYQNEKILLCHSHSHSQIHLEYCFHLDLKQSEFFEGVHPLAAGELGLIDAILQPQLIN